MENNRPFWNALLNFFPIKWFCNLKISKKAMQIPIFQKIFNYEMVTYIFFGVVTTVINYISYWLLCLAFSIPMSNVSAKQNLLSVLANTIAFIISLIFAFVTNKIIVFGSRDYSFKTVIKEFVSFTTARLLTFGLESLILFVAGALKFNLLIAKIFANVLVVILNYIFSKLFIFKNKGAK